MNNLSIDATVAKYETIANQIYFYAEYVSF